MDVSGFDVDGWGRADADDVRSPSQADTSKALSTSRPQWIVLLNFREETW